MTNQKPEVIGLLGVRGSGKTFTRNKILNDKNTESVCAHAAALDFKDGLFEMVEDLLGFPVPTDEKEYDNFKSSVIGLHKGFVNRLISSFVDTATRDALTGRKVLQRVGTDMIRSRMPNYWVDIFVRKARNYVITQRLSVICADVRFPNEVRALINMADVAVPKFTFCDYRSPRYDATDTHPSEALAQTLLKMGFKDGQEIPMSVMLEVAGG